MLQVRKFSVRAFKKTRLTHLNTLSR